METIEYKKKIKDNVFWGDIYFKEYYKVQNNFLFVNINTNKALWRLIIEIYKQNILKLNELIGMIELIYHIIIIQLDDRLININIDCFGTL